MQKQTLHHRLKILFLVHHKKENSCFFCEWTHMKHNFSIFISYTFIINVSWGNRTLNCPLGGGCYIHLTKETGHSIFLLYQILTYITTYFVQENFLLKWKVYFNFDKWTHVEQLCNYYIRFYFISVNYHYSDYTAIQQDDW